MRKKLLRLPTFAILALFSLVIVLLLFASERGKQLWLPGIGILLVVSGVWQLVALFWRHRS